MILISAIIAGIVMGASVSDMIGAYKRTFKQVRFALLTISLMMGIGFTTRYAGMDATIGLVFAGHGRALPLLRPVRGLDRRGVDRVQHVVERAVRQPAADLRPRTSASTSTTSPARTCTGGLWGKMISPQSIVVAATGTNYHGHEDEIMRGIFWHSVALVMILGVWVYILEYVAPFSSLIPR